MRAATLVMLVHQWNHHRAIGRTAHIGEGQIGFGTQRLTIVVAEAQGVDQCARVFQLTIQPHHCRLAITFNCISTANGIKDHRRQQRAQLRGCAMDGRLQIFDKSLPGPRVFQHRRRHDQFQRFGRSTATFNQDCLNVDQGLANLYRHAGLRFLFLV